MSIEKLFPLWFSYCYFGLSYRDFSSPTVKLQTWSDSILPFLYISLPSEVGIGERFFGPTLNYFISFVSYYLGIMKSLLGFEY